NSGFDSGGVIVCSFGQTAPGHQSYYFTLIYLHCDAAAAAVLNALQIRHDWSACLPQSRTGRLQFSQPYDTSGGLGQMLPGRQVFSAVGSRILRKRQRRDSRRTLPAFAIKSIVRSKKTKRAIGKLFLIPDASLRHIDDAPRHDLAHSTGIGRPGALASRLEEPLPGLIESRTKHRNGFGIEVRLRPDQINNAGHPRTPSPKRPTCPAGIAAGN